MRATEGPDNPIQHCAYVWKQLPVPVIAAVHGVAYGAGFQIAMAADIRFATPDSRFGIPAAKLGLGYEYDGLAKLARIVGPSRALSWVQLGSILGSVLG